jgi:integrase
VAVVSLGYEGGARKRKYLYGETRQEVAEKLTHVLGTVQQGLPVRSDERLTVGAYLTRWLEEVARPKVRPSTHQSYERLLRLYVLPALGRRPLAKLTPQEVQAMLNALGKRTPRLSPRTVQYTHAVLRSALGRAVKWGLVARNVATLAEPPAGQRAKAQPLTVAQAQALLTTARGQEHRLEPLLTVTLATGLRLGELLALRWQDVNLAAGTLTVRYTLERVPKRDRATGPAPRVDGADGADDGGAWRLAPPKSARGSRSLPLIPAAAAALKLQRTRVLEARLAAGSRWREGDFVFPSSLGTPLGGRNVFREYQELLAAAGIPHKRFHDLRHSTATFLLAAGVAERVVMEMLGHSQISLTMNTYAHVLPAVLGEAAEKLGALFTIPRASEAAGGAQPG